MSLTTTPSAGSDARHWAVVELQKLGIVSADMRDDVELVVSELVSNAVQHGSSPIVVTLACAATELHVSVTDGGGPPHLFDSLPPDPTASRGRGLAIVATLAAAWGIWALETGPGKTVWCRLRDADVEQDR